MIEVNNKKDKKPVKERKSIKENKENKEKKSIVETGLNSTDKITLQFMTNPHYNNVVNITKNNSNKILLDEKKEDIIYFKKNILNLTKKILNSIENNEQINLPDNVLSSCNNYLFNIVNYIHHRKTANLVQEELNTFNHNNNNNINSSNINNNNNNNTNNNNNNTNNIDLDKLINDSNTILYKKENKTVTMDKFIKTVNKNKKEEIIPNKKNIYK